VQLCVTQVSKELKYKVDSD